MQVTPNQNNIQKPTNVPQQNVNTTTGPQPQQQQCATNPAGYIPPQVPYYPPCYSQPQVQNQPQQQGQQAQNVQVPATAAGVNIQIFNPSVGTPGSPAPTYNVNAPCYPSGYYTNSLGQDGKMHPNNSTCNCCNGGNGVNPNGNSTNSTNSTTNTQNDKKTEKRKIVELNDDYIRMLESYLNSQDEQVRLNAAKDVYARLEEDDSRHDDKALTALINKMLQDPSDEIRLLALTALEGRLVDGDDYSVNVLKNIQQSNSGYGQDAAAANKILLQMSSRQVEKEFEVKEKPSTKTETKTETTTSRKS